MVNDFLAVAYDAAGGYLYAGERIHAAVWGEQQLARSPQAASKLVLQNNVLERNI
jgi:hypothetical protein